MLQEVALRLVAYVDGVQGLGTEPEVGPFHKSTEDFMRPFELVFLASGKLLESYGSDAPLS